MGFVRLPGFPARSSKDSDLRDFGGAWITILPECDGGMWIYCDWTLGVTIFAGEAGPAVRVLGMDDFG